MNKTLTPAYGRDYKSAKAARACFLSGNDWILADIMSKWDGKPCSMRDFPPGTPFNLRYKKLTQLCIVQTPFGQETLSLPPRPSLGSED